MTGSLPPTDHVILQVLWDIMLNYRKIYSWHQTHAAQSRETKISSEPGLWPVAPEEKVLPEPSLCGKEPTEKILPLPEPGLCGTEPTQKDNMASADIVGQEEGGDGKLRENDRNSEAHSLELELQVMTLNTG